MSEQTNKEDELGALWVKTSARGEFMTGTIGGVKVVCFKNTRAENNEKAPQWRVLKSKPREDAETPQAMSASDIPFAWLLPLVGALIGAGLGLA